MSEEDDKAKGWMDYDTWVQQGGDPDQWRDKDEFIKKGEEILPILQNRLDRTEKQLEQLKNDTASMLDQQQKLTEQQKKEAYDKAKAEYDRQLSELRRTRYSAMEDGDYETARRAEEQEADLQNNEPQPPSTTPQSQQPSATPANDPDFVAWHAENPWFDPTGQKNRAMAAFAREESVRLQKSTGLSGRALYDRVTEEVKREFPQQFENQKREEGAATVEGEAPPADSGGRKKSYNDLPQEAKDAINRILTNNPKIANNQERKDQMIQGYLNQYFPSKK